MLSESSTSVPSWLALGLALGILVSLLLAGVFYLGGRLFPTQAAPDGGRIDGMARRRAEIRAYLRDIDEPFAEDYPVDGQTVAFFLPLRNVAITFDAHAYFRLERAGFYAVLCEHEMPGHQLGRRLPFDVPDVEPSLDELDDPVDAAFRRLGLTSSASADEVKAAYRSKVKEAHPDHGGDEREFQQVREAYATVRNHTDRRVTSR